MSVPLWLATCLLVATAVAGPLLGLWMAGVRRRMAPRCTVCWQRPGDDCAHFVAK